MGLTRTSSPNGYGYTLTKNSKKHFANAARYTLRGLPSIIQYFKTSSKTEGNRRTLGRVRGRFLRWCKRASHSLKPPPIQPRQICSLLLARRLVMETRLARHVLGHDAVRSSTVFAVDFDV